MVKDIASKRGTIAFEINVGKMIAVLKCVISNRGNAVRNGNTCYTPTFRKCPIKNTGDTVWQDNTGKAITIVKRIIPNGNNTIGNTDAGQMGTIKKCALTNTGDAVWYGVGTGLAARTAD